MKRIVLAILACLLASSALAATAYLHPATETVRWLRPPYADLPDGRRMWDASDEQFVEAGWVFVAYDDACPPARRLVAFDPPAVSCMSQEDWDALEAERAAYAFPEPDVTVPVLDADGNRTGTARLLVDASGQLVIVTDTASPQRTAAAQIMEFRVKSGAKAAKIATAKAKNAGANNVPAMREAIADLIAAMEGAE
jgi:hypothetical protein